MAWWVDFIALAAIWGSSFLFTKISAQELGPMLTAFGRVAIAAAVLLPLALVRGHGAALRGALKPILFVGLLNSGLPFALFAFAVLHINTGLASILNATAPLWGAIVAWVWLREPPGVSRGIGLAIGFFGVVLLSLEKAGFKSESAPLALGLCLLATLCYGITASYTRRHLAGIHPLATATGSQLGAMVGLSLPASFMAPSPTVLQAVAWPVWAALLVLGVVCTAAAYVLYFRIIERGGPSRALAVTFLIPVFGVAWGAAFLNEAITLWMVGAAAVVVLGTALATGVLKIPVR